MRVIAGTARGTVLCAPEGGATRPTSDRLKENLFNILLVRGFAFLDLFSGSGAIGIEALSRGASSVTFVEKSRKASDVIKKNLNKTHFDAKATVLTMTVSQAVQNLSEDARKLKFGIVFMDPPYESDYVDETMDILSKTELILPGGIVAAELPADRRPTNSPVFTEKKVKVYGDKKFILWTRN